MSFSYLPACKFLRWEHLSLVFAHSSARQVGMWFPRSHAALGASAGVADRNSTFFIFYPSCLFMVKSRSSLLLPIDNTRRTLSPEYWRCSPLSPVPLGGVTLEGEGEWISLSLPCLSLSLLLLPCHCFCFFLVSASLSILHFPLHTHTHTTHAHPASTFTSCHIPHACNAPIRSRENLA